LVSHKRSISHVTFNTYYLTPFNHIHQDPGKYGIEYEKRALPFRFFIPFKNKNGMTADWADQIEKIYRSLINAKDQEVQAAAPGHSSISDSCGRLSEGCVQLRLNNEICSMRYIRDARTENYTFLQDEGVPKHELACGAA
ncbi:MAG: hypothetical protein MUC52_02845, partial [Candidatus Omnitrophica bacterium]|nr:hypothetical protein [Candidatus Omnitrophota bacterium]